MIINLSEIYFEKYWFNVSQNGIIIGLVEFKVNYDFIISGRFTNQLRFSLKSMRSRVESKKPSYEQKSNST